MTEEVQAYIAESHAAVRERLKREEIAKHDAEPLPDIPTYRSLDAVSGTVALRLDISELLVWGDTPQRQLILWNKVAEICGEYRADVDIKGYDGLDGDVSWITPAPEDELAEARKKLEHVRTANEITRRARWENIKREYEELSKEFGE